jgi:hypothetical protein
VKPTLLVHLTVMSAIDEKIGNAKTNESHGEIENCANEGGSVSGVTANGLVSVMG